MFTRQPLAMLMMAGGMFLAGCSKTESVHSASTVAAPVAPTFKVVAPSRQIMLAMTIPASDKVFGAAAEPPTTDEQWVAVERAALELAESGNLLLIPGRAVDEAEWSQYSHMLIDTASKAYAAAQAKDIDGVSDAGNVIYEACEGCHKKYMPQPAAQ